MLVAGTQLHTAPSASQECHRIPPLSRPYPRLPDRRGRGQAGTANLVQQLPG
jgi:hypothetical protein